MRYLLLVWSGLWRKKARTIFTLLSVVIAFLLFGLLQGLNEGFLKAAITLNANRLYTSNRFAMVEGMPIALANQIATVPGVTDVSHLTYFGGFYQNKRNAIGVYATKIDSLFRIYDGLKIPANQLEKMQRVRAGALITRQLATKYGWKIGDTVPIGTSIWTKKDGRNDYQFDIVGIFDTPSNYGTGDNSFYINSDYFNETRRFGNDQVHYFISSIDNPRRSEEISKTIDELFANSPNETKTQTEQALAASQLKQLADTNFIVNSIVGAVLFTLLFLTGNTMMQSVRERIPELAVLKTLGFTDGKVAGLVFAESLLICVVAALIGLGLAELFFLFLRETLGGASIPARVIVAGIAIAAMLALISGLPPALRAKRLRIVDALAGR
jgi:putative ABC transport system permease protein